VEIAHEAERHIDDAAFGHNNSMQEANHEKDARAVRLQMLPSALFRQHQRKCQTRRITTFVTAAILQFLSIDPVRYARGDLSTVGDPFG
jgi:hypothetical protein